MQARGGLAPEVLMGAVEVGCLLTAADDDDSDVNDVFFFFFKNVFFLGF